VIKADPHPLNILFERLKDFGHYAETLALSGHWIDAHYIEVGPKQLQRRLHVVVLRVAKHVSYIESLKQHLLLGLMLLVLLKGS
jgi:hypothetical protein